MYHKEPTRSHQFVKKDVWKNIFQHELDLVLVHARGASKGVGEPSVNSNNHPFTNNDKSLSLIHNGRIDDIEYNALKQKYEVQSNCDSEILLRIIENSENTNSELGKEFYPHRISGIKDVFSFINEGHMAVAVGERGCSGDRMLWLFRNPYRPLWVVDLREVLGQIYFFSEPTIWEEAVQECGNFKNTIKSQKLVELPSNQIWYFRIVENESVPNKVCKFNVVKKNPQPWQFDGKKHVIKKVATSFRLVTELDENDKIKIEVKDPKFNFLNDEFRLDRVDLKCNEIIDVVNNIRQYTEQLVQENSICKTEFEELIADLESKKKELEAISTIINR